MQLRMSPSRIRWAATIAAMGLSAVAVVLGYSLTDPAERNTKLALDIATLVGLIIGTAVGYTQLSLLVDQRREERTKSLREGALWYSLSGHQEVLNAIHELEEAFPKEYQEMKPVSVSAIRDNEKLKRSLELVLAHWERMARTIFAEAADERMAFESFGNRVVAFYDIHQDYIESQWSGKNPRSYLYLIALRPVWAHRLAQEGPRPTPFYVQHPPEWYAQSGRVPDSPPTITAQASVPSEAE